MDIFDTLSNRGQLETIEAKLDRILALLDKPTCKKRETLSSVYSPEFEELWSIFPKRQGSNPKQSASIAVQARLRAGETFAVLREGTLAYRAYCDAKGDTGGEYVMQAVRFYGRNQEYLLDWTPPAPKEKQPKTDDEWLAYGKSKGMEPRTGESWRDYIDRVRSSI